MRAMVVRTARERRANGARTVRSGRVDAAPKRQVRLRSYDTAAGKGCTAVPGWRVRRVRIVQSERAAEAERAGVTHPRPPPERSLRRESLFRYPGPHMAQRQTLPVLPLRGTVIFPGVTQPIAAGRPGTLRAIEAALKSDRVVFAVEQRDNT